MIGSLGKNIIFEVSDQKVLTFKDYSREISAKWETHNIIGKKAKSEFIGPELQKITFTIHLNATYGVRPRKIIERLTGMVEKGTVERFVVGGKKIGRYYWKITSMSEAWDIVLRDGEIIAATLNLTLEEYL